MIEVIFEDGDSRVPDLDDEGSNLGQVVRDFEALDIGARRHDLRGVRAGELNDVLHQHGRRHVQCAFAVRVLNALEEFLLGLLVVFAQVCTAETADRLVNEEQPPRQRPAEERRPAQNRHPGGQESHCGVLGQRLGQYARENPQPSDRDETGNNQHRPRQCRRLPDPCCQRYHQHDERDARRCSEQRDGQDHRVELSQQPLAGGGLALGFQSPLQRDSAEVDQRQAQRR